MVGLGGGGGTACIYDATAAAERRALWYQGPGLSAELHKSPFPCAAVNNSSGLHLEQQLEDVWKGCMVMGGMGGLLVLLCERQLLSLPPFPVFVCLLIPCPPRPTSHMTPRAVIN